MAVIIFKPSTVCNANCVYCEVAKSESPTTISDDLLELVFERINEYLQDNPAENVSLTWHGGEVCLLGARFFRKVIGLQKTTCRETQGRIRHLIQTNCTAINQELIDAFLELRINNIGTSFDPLLHIRGIGEERDTREYNRRFFEGVSLLEKNGLSWGVIYVVHRESLKSPKELFYYLTNLNIRNMPMFNRVYIYGEDPFQLSITPTEYADFLGTLLPLHWEKRIRFPSLLPVSSMIQMIQNMAGHLQCEYMGNCAHRWLYIGPEGETSHCGRSGDYNCRMYGKIQTSSISALLGDPARRQFIQRQEELLQGECEQCRFWKICHGGCPVDALLGKGDFFARSADCDWIKHFMNTYLEPVTGLQADMRHSS